MSISPAVKQRSPSLSYAVLLLLLLISTTTAFVKSTFFPVLSSLQLFPPPTIARELSQTRSPVRLNLPIYISIGVPSSRVGRLFFFCLFVLALAGLLQLEIPPKGKISDLVVVESSNKQRERQRKTVNVQVMALVWRLHAANLSSVL